AHNADLRKRSLWRAIVIECLAAGAATAFHPVVADPVVPVEVGPESPLQHWNAFLARGPDGAADVVDLPVAPPLAQPCLPVEIDWDHHRFEDKPRCLTGPLDWPNIFPGPEAF